MSFPFQKGFIPGSEGCFKHNFMLDATLEDARRNGNEVAVAWLDLEDAFGSIPHHHISRTLQEIEESVPTTWKQSCTILIHKGGNEEEMENWRPIALQPTIGKLFSGIIADRIYCY
ncbi:hypothetical protein J437_LFUL019127 [Ladona fulva]|uniref:Reverse transcriptase domain-containing protein n=1 Tax=Ladona fulva TaxID=123851 RepID=A0A8K0P9V0_LADFU|nr:hypothetical protein J437_LFUL019127 [Ladona fulva]